jgi:uncharacterized protein (DUF2235 family)
MKRLVVCCDGTWNRPDQISQGVAAPTNVAKLALAVADEDADGNPQLLHYQAGVGTRPLEHMLGGGFGVGLSRNVKECYRFVVENYAPGDELYFFGFSRGAFTARSTVGLVRNAGVLRPEHRHRVDQAYDLYRDPRRDTEPNGIAAQLFRRSYSYDEVHVHFVGVWDTVGALGIPIDGFRPPLLSNMWTFHDTKLSRYVRNAFHAVAIDERRGPFEPTLWDQQDDATDQTLEQVFFAGVHCDIGGGYGEPELSDIALGWMAEKAGGCDLALKPDHLVRDREHPGTPERRDGHTVAPNPLGRLHDSRTSFYLVLPAYDRPLIGTDGGAIGSSAKTRYDKDATYRPPRLTEALNAGEPTVKPVPD